MVVTVQNKFSQEMKARLYKWTLSLLKNIDSLDRSMISSVLGKQLLRSGTSIIANFVEAQAGSSTKDFANFLNYSLKSANESKLWLTLLVDSGKMNKEDVEDLRKELQEISMILGSILIKIRKKV